MSAPLPEFFAQMRPYLSGERPLPAVVEALGASPSGDDNFAFYRVLAERNLFKILFELYRPLRTLIVRQRSADTWRQLVREYVDTHLPAGHHPNAAGAAFSEFLAARRQRDDSQPTSWEEIADFCWTRTYVVSAPDGPDDGFDQRLHVRQYTHPISQIVTLLERDAEAELPEPAPELLLIYRHWETLETRLFRPSAAGLVALAVRQGLPVPEPLAVVPDDHVAIAQEQLVAHGVLSPS
ncbi:MAG: hypothetical protein AAF799_00835 [Myxococcota bacterium]